MKTVEKEKNRQLRSIEKEMRKERNRMKDFAGKTDFENSDSDPETVYDVEQGKYSDNDSNDSLIINSESTIHREQFTFNPPRGYQKHSVYKIKVIEGTFAVKNQVSKDTVTACHFTSLYAIMYLVHHPVSTFCYRTVDRILEKGIELHKALQLKILEENTQFKNILVDNISYELVVQLHSSYNNENDLKIGLEEYFSQFKYLMLREMDTCFAIYQDEKQKLHLFNSYGFTEQKAYWVMLDGVAELMDHLKMISVGAWSLSSIYTVNILSYKKNARAANVNPYCFNKTCGLFGDDKLPNETVDGILFDNKVIWSRLQKNNYSKVPRGSPLAKWKDFDIEVDNILYSLWGNIHPNLKVFGVNAGRQHLTVSITSLMMAHLYKIDDWTADLLDSIVINGNRYFQESVAKITQENHEFTMNDLEQHFAINSFKFDLQVRLKVYGKLYSIDPSSLNLSKSLQYFFLQKKYKYGILQCKHRFLAIGRDGQNYFMFDCQSTGFPLFAKNQGTVYVMKCCSLWALQLCILQTLKERTHNVEFLLFSVKIKLSMDEVKSQKQKEVTPNSEEQ